MNNCPPVMICGFNRPECLKMVLEAVRAARPAQLFLALDYPRPGREEDVKRWEECKCVFDTVDWPCAVKKNYAESNLGCGRRMTSAITWVFEQVDRAIILEDDCVPHITFFRFCGELLEKYKDDSRVGMIAGHDEHFHLNKIDTYCASYYFDRMTSIWGWATWKRAWEKHDPDMKFWPIFSEHKILYNVFRKKAFADACLCMAGKLYRKEQNTWAGAWFMTMLKENWLSVHPARNLVANVGNGISSRAKNFSKIDTTSPWQNRPVYEMEFPLKHPITMIPNVKSEYYYWFDVQTNSWWDRIPKTPAEFKRKFCKLLKLLSKRIGL